MKRIKNLWLCFCLLSPLLMVQALQAQMPTNNSIIQITDGLYRGSNGMWHNLIYVTSDGILLVDTINTTFAEWLKPELEKQFPDLPVKYVIYSHSHWDHSEGGAIFQDTATYIAQETMLENMDGRYPNMPGDMVDRNNNGTIEPVEIKIPWDEAPGICGYPPIDFKDTDGDGSFSSTEFFSEVVPPSIVYSDKMTLVFGGKTIELIYPGLNHANDMTVAYFPEEKLVFVVDFLADALVREDIHSLPSACGPFDGHSMNDWIDSYHKVEAIDFDILSTGHGGPLRFSKQDVVETREYFEYLQAQVSQAIDAGLSLDEMKQTLMLEPYSGWALYERLREKNIEAAYSNLRAY